MEPGGPRAARFRAGDEEALRLLRAPQGTQGEDQERDVEAAVFEFEKAKKRLYRADGSQVFGDKEHSERLSGLLSGLREAVEAVATDATGDAEGYDKEALARSYADPASMVSYSERGQLEASRSFVKEDCKDMAVPELTGRTSTVSAGSDRVAMALHARYGRRRVEALNAEALRNAQEGRSMGPEAAAYRATPARGGRVGARETARGPEEGKVRTDA